MGTIFEDADQFDKELQEAGDRWDKAIFGEARLESAEEPEDDDDFDDDEDDDEVED